MAAPTLGPADRTLLRPASRIVVALDPSTFPISHIVVVLLENHAYDSLFGAYCNANNASQVVASACPALANGTPKGVCIPKNLNDSAKGCVKPFFWTKKQLAFLTDCKHGWLATERSLDGGKLDGFVDSCVGDPTPMGEYNGGTIPTYWDIAEKFGLGDNTFSSALSYSLPNHWFLLAGSAPPAGFSVSPAKANATDRSAYLSEANHTGTVEQLLLSKGTVPWRYYDWPLKSYSTAIGMVGEGLKPGSAYNIWSPLAAKNQSYAGSVPGHFVSRYSFFSDVAAGALPQVSWIIPGGNQSDHPPANITQGERLIQQVVDAVEGSPEWGSTAIFVSWDEFGGFYDHVLPPSVDSMGLSFRTGLLAVSPYTPPGLVLSTRLNFESLLAFVEWRFGLGCLTARDCSQLQEVDNGGGVLGFFPLVGSGPRSPVYIDPPSNATYPVPALAPAAIPYNAPPTPVTAADSD